MYIVGLSLFLITFNLINLDFTEHVFLAMTLITFLLIVFLFFVKALN